VSQGGQFPLSFDNCRHSNVEMTDLVTHLVLLAIRTAGGKPQPPLPNGAMRPWRRLPGDLPSSRGRFLGRASEELRREFKQATRGIVATSAKREVAQRIGQQLFRKDLLSLWQGACAVTGLDVPDLLRASHAKPWSESTDAERLDVCNGLLLAPHLDAAFDKGLVAVADDGRVLVSPRLSEPQRRALGLREGLRVQHPEWLTEGHRTYLGWHRARYGFDKL
jgi:hypothetical protein